MRVDTFFQFAHLPPHLQAISRPFCEAALAVDAAESFDLLACHEVLDAAPDRSEAAEGAAKLDVFHADSTRDAQLRALLEAKDCAVRAYLPDHPGERHPVEAKP
jgi:hypothetical protein